MNLGTTCFKRVLLVCRSQRFQLSPVKEARTSISTSTDNQDQFLEGEGQVQESVEGEDEADVSLHEDTEEHSCHLVWCDNPEDARKLQIDRPQFWLILNIEDNTVNLYFQFREGQHEVMLPWKQFQMQLAKEVCQINMTIWFLPTSYTYLILLLSDQGPLSQGEPKSVVG